LTPAELSAAIIRILSALQSSGQLSAADLPAEVVIERPKNREHGDWATNAAMQLAGKFGMNPRAFAEMLAPELEVLDGVAKVDIAGPGFINLWSWNRHGWHQAQPRICLSKPNWPNPPRWNPLGSRR
jgi:arginyl-tRNA synthetase